MGQQVGDQLSNYRLIRLLGSGGFAEVWLGKHQNDQREAAIKVIKVQLPTVDEQTKFLNEAHHLERLVHSHIVKLLDCGIEGERPYLILEYAPNGTLRQRHPRTNVLPISQVIHYVKQITAGLQYAHNSRIIHRDIKPENMLFNSNNDILLGDFGIALPGQTLPYPKTQDVMGTTGYMAPEQLNGHPAFGSDQYSLAIVVYEWLCGSLPFKGGLAAILKQQQAVPPSLKNKVPDISASLEQVIFKALSYEVSDRFRRVEDFANALEQAVNNPNWSIHLPLPNNPLIGTVPQSLNGPSMLAPTLNVRNIPDANIPDANNLAALDSNTLDGGNQHGVASPFIGNNLAGNTPLPPTNPVANTPPNINMPPNSLLNASPTGGFNSPPIVPLYNQAQPQVVLPDPGGLGAGGNSPFNQTGGPFGGGTPPGLNNQQTSLHAAPTVPAQPPFMQNPFTGNQPYGPQRQTYGTEPKIQSNWLAQVFNRNFMKQSKNQFFLYGGGIVDFLFAVALGGWLNAGNLSWNLWLGSFVIAWVVRALCAGVKPKYLAFPLALALAFYWFVGSWALGTIVQSTIKFEPVPPHIIALLVGFAGFVLHLHYVIEKKH